MVECRAAEPRAVRWEVLKQELGVELPPDFRAFAEAYPRLEFDDFLLVHLPEPGNESSFIATVRGAAKVVRHLSESGDAKGYVPFPEPGGLLEWGSSNEGDSFYWRTWSVSPAEWPVVVSGRNDDWSEYAIGAVDFLAAIYRRDLVVPGLPSADFPGEDPTVAVL
jgi:hypothetical protein